MPDSDKAVEECDATGYNQGETAGYKNNQAKIINSKLSNTFAAK